MYVLNYNGKSKKFTTIPSIKEVEDFTGNLISFGLYDSIITNKIAHGMSGTYYLHEVGVEFKLTGDVKWD